MTDEYGNFYTPENGVFYSQFVYSDLDPASDSIRLLRIKPSISPNNATEAMIQCDLLDAISLGSIRDRYTTVSYAAGDPRDIETIIVNGLSFNAFANLGHALRQARHFWKDNFEKHELLLWADQVCINQHNPLERSHQVKLMGDIYSASEQVLISLSTEHDLAGGLEWLRHTLRNLPSGLICVSNPEDSDGDVDDNCPVRAFFHNNFDQKGFHLGWDAFIRTALTSSWWSRAWVRQEFIRSTDAYFMAAFESLHWKTLEEFMSIYYSALYAFEDSVQNCPYRSGQCTGPAASCQACLLGNDSSIFWEAGKRAYRLLGSKIDSKPGALRDLVDNLGDAHLCKASDPRDLVYAFFGFSNHSYGLNPDYSRDLSFQDVSTQLAHNIICRGKNLDILEKAYLTRGSEVDPDLPSWVPDWRRVQLLQDGHFHKDRTSCVTAFFSFQADDKGRQIRVLKTRGALHTVLRREIGDHKWPQRFLSATSETIPVVGPVREGDELWVLDGANCFYILRRQGQCYQLVGEALDNTGLPPELCLSLNKIKGCFIRNDPRVQSISIC